MIFVIVVVVYFNVTPLQFLHLRFLPVSSKIRPNYSLFLSRVSRFHPRSQNIISHIHTSLAKNFIPIPSQIITRSINRNLNENWLDPFQFLSIGEIIVNSIIYPYPFHPRYCTLDKCHILEILNVSF